MHKIHKKRSICFWKKCKNISSFLFFSHLFLAFFMRPFFVDFPFCRFYVVFCCLFCSFLSLFCSVVVYCVNSFFDFCFVDFFQKGRCISPFFLLFSLFILSPPFCDLLCRFCYSFFCRFMSLFQSFFFFKSPIVFIAFCDIFESFLWSFWVDFNGFLHVFCAFFIGFFVVSFLLSFL